MGGFSEPSSLPWLVARFGTLYGAMATVEGRNFTNIFSGHMADYHGTLISKLRCLVRWPTVVPWWHTRRLRQALLVNFRQLTWGVEDLHPEITKI